MANRGMTAAEIAKWSDPNGKYAYLVKLVFSTTLYFTTAPKDIIYDAHLYSSTGDLLEISDITEDIMPMVGSCSITLSCANDDNISVALLEDFIDAPVTIVLIKLTDDIDVDAALTVFEGTIKKPNVTENPETGDSRVVWSLASHWAAFEQQAGRYCNDTDQQRLYSGDTFFKFADQTLRDIKWGRA